MYEIFSRSFVTRRDGIDRSSRTQNQKMFVTRKVFLVVCILRICRKNKSQVSRKAYAMILHFLVQLVLI